MENLLFKFHDYQDRRSMFFQRIQSQIQIILLISQAFELLYCIKGSSQQQNLITQLTRFIEWTFPNFHVLFLHHHDLFAVFAESDCFELAFENLNHV